MQLRLQQVVNAPSDKREDLLKELENFAFRGIPNLSSPRVPALPPLPGDPSATPADPAHNPTVASSGSTDHSSSSATNGATDHDVSYRKQTQHFVQNLHWSLLGGACF